ncbi:MAG TPA: MBL fold metallo-hydrolase [Acidimicrobiales bacterium]|nr:MBL fold metallo-hydrolase [Acidimicrobiales bacterium]
MKLLFCGVRGSTPAPGADFVRYGGNTTCLAVTPDGGPPRLVLDAGTGLANLSSRLDGEAFRGTILLGHLHWDHTHGLPFFAAGDRDDSEVTVLMPAQGDPEDILARVLSPPHFPITPSQLRGCWRFGSVEEGTHEIEGLTVVAREIPHTGGRTFGYRVSDGRASFAYLSDHMPIALGPGEEGLGEYHDAALELARGVDLLVHDGQHLAAQFPEVAYLGHSAVEYAVGLARTAGARGLMLFHHDPRRTDDDLDAIVARHRTGAVPVDAAAEGTVVVLPTP